MVIASPLYPSRAHGRRGVLGEAGKSDERSAAVDAESERARLAVDNHLITEPTAFPCM